MKLTQMYTSEKNVKLVLAVDQTISPQSPNQYGLLGRVRELVRQRHCEMTGEI